jgi:acyl carrier protein
MTNKAELTASLLDIIKEFKGDDFPADAAQKVPGTLHIREDLAMDSLDIINFLFRIEEDHGVTVTGQDLGEQNLFILGNLVDYVLTKL